MSPVTPSAPQRLPRRRSRTVAAMIGTLLATMLPLLASPALSAGSVSLTALDVAYSEDFNTLAASGTSSTLPNGWSIAESGTNANTTYTAGTGSGNAGDTYSFGASGVSERAFGGLLSGSLVPLNGASFMNNTGATITALDVAYTGEQWRLGTADRGPDRIDFQYSLDATSLTAGTFVDANALDFASVSTTGTVGARDGNAVANRSAIAAQLSGLSIGAGATFWIRWLDLNASGADDGLAVDDFSLTPHATDAAPFVSATSPLAGATGVIHTTNIEITFSEPVNITGAWFTISCTTSGAHEATISGGPSVFVLNPDSDLALNETCTIAIVASQVADQDADDPPDNMAGDASFSFTTADQACGDDATPIHEAQGAGPTTPLSGAISIEGIVVGDYQGTGQFGGYFVQEENADADGLPATSEGIFVFNASRPVSLGDKVRVRGNVGEFSGMTQLSSVTFALVCSVDNPAPDAADVNFPVAAIPDLEAFEGMRVSIDQELTVTETFTLFRFGEVSLSVGGRLANPTNVVDPGAPALALQDLNNRSRILLDDGDNTQNRDPVFYPQGGLSALNTLRIGDTLPSLTGVLEFRFGVYRVQPIDIADIEFDHSNPRPVAPAPVGGNLQVAAFNVLNFFNGDGAGGGFPTARGAETPAELTHQTQKIVNAMLALDADIYSMSELENDASGELSAIDDLVDALNAAAGAGTFDYIDTGVIGTDAIKVGIVYKTAVVSPIGTFAILDGTVDPRFVSTLNRPALAQTFQLVDVGGRVTIIANHLKSKGSACPEDIPTPLNDGQQNCNVTRTNAAHALVDWAATDPTGSGDPDVLIVGDLNSYAKEDPIEVFEDAGYTNEIARFLGDEAYSFVFQGQSGYLDHALTSPTLTSQVTRVTEWHINADEPVALDYNVNFKSPGQVTSFFAGGPYRSSDHDPVLIGIDVAHIAPATLLAPIGSEVTAKAGQVLPIIFSLGGFLGLDILDGAPQVFLCADYPDGSSVDAQAAGASGLSYDPVLDRYTFAWKTLRSWADSCRTIVVTFDDGSSVKADVNLTR